MCFAAVVFFEAGQPVQRLRRKAPVLRARGRNFACGQVIEKGHEFVRCQILVVILANLGHGRVGAGTKALHLFPRELAILGELMRIWRDLFFADRHKVFGPADHAGCGAADLDMCHGTNRLQLEHEVECRHLETANIGHAQHLRDMLNRGTGEPALLLLRAPEQRDDCAGLTAFGVFGDLRFGPCLIGRGEGEAFGLFGVQTAEHLFEPLVFDVPSTRWRSGTGQPAADM